MNWPAARSRRIAGRAAHAGVLAFFVTFLTVPVYWMLITTFKTTQDLHNTANNPYLFNDPPTLHHLRVLFEDTQYLQWLADRQLGDAAAAGRDGGMTIGLYRDLAVGVNPHGAEAWADQELVVPGASIGAPPDPLSRLGQDWGLAPISPLAYHQFPPLVASL